MSCHLPCHKPLYRKGIGPTGKRKQWLIRVDECLCGFAFVAQDKITWEQYSWIRRRNARLENEKNMGPASNYTQTDPKG